MVARGREGCHGNLLQLSKDMSNCVKLISFLVPGFWNIDWPPGKNVATDLQVCSTYDVCQRENIEEANGQSVLDLMTL